MESSSTSKQYCCCLRIPASNIYTQELPPQTSATIDIISHVYEIHDAVVDDSSIESRNVPLEFLLQRLHEVDEVVLEGASAIGSVPAAEGEEEVAGGLSGVGVVEEGDRLHRSGRVGQHAAHGGPLHKHARGGRGRAIRGTSEEMLHRDVEVAPLGVEHHNRGREFVRQRAESVHNVNREHALTHIRRTPLVHLLLGLLALGVAAGFQCIRDLRAQKVARNLDNGARNVSGKTPALVILYIMSEVLILLH